MIFGVCVFIMNDKGELLSVSRKDDPSDIGLPGGKVEAGETPLEAALRELFEESGYKADPRYAQLIYHAETDGQLAVTYQIPYSAIKQAATPTETGVVAWVSPEVLANGKTFGNYNRGLFKTIGLKFPDRYMPSYSMGAAVKKK